MTQGKIYYPMNGKKDFGGFPQFCQEIYTTAN